VGERLGVCPLPVEHLAWQVSPAIPALDLLGRPEQLKVAAMRAPERLIG